MDRGDWLGAVMLVIGFAVVAQRRDRAPLGPWYVATGFFKQRVVEHGVWSLAAMTLGLGVLPMVATVAALLSRQMRSDP